MHRRRRAAGVLAVAVAAAASLGDQLPTSLPSPATSTAASPPVEHQVPRRRPDGALANLDPALRDALSRAASDASREGVELRVVSGWRSPAHQRRLLEEAVAEYGSEVEAARWVASPEKSAHVAGDAVDIGPPAARAWLSERGAAYGLCQIYGNEPWHFELRPDAAEHGCPPMYADPTHDPRMQP